MKKFLFTLAALLMAGSAFAGNVYIPDTEFTEDQIGKVQLLPVYLVLDNEYVNGWDFTFEYPEGLTVGTLKKNNAVLNQTAAINEDGDEETVSVVLNGDAYHNIGAIIQGGYWDPDGDGVYELYGAVKIGPTGEFKLYEIRVTPTEEFKGGDITITWMYSGGFDNRNGQPKCQDSGVTTVHLTAPSVPEEPKDLTGTIEYSEPTEDGKITFTYTGEEDVTMTVNGEAYNGEEIQLVEGDNAFEVVVEAEGYNTIKADFTFSWTAPVVTPDLPGYIIIGAPATDGTFYVNYLTGDYDGPYTMVVTINGEVVEPIVEGTYAAVEGENVVVVTISAPGYNDKVATNTFNYHYPTTAPAPEFVWNAETFTMEAVCEGHEVILYMNGTEVANPYTVEQTAEEQVITFSAMTVAADEDNNSAVVSYEPVVVPAKAEVEYTAVPVVNVEITDDAYIFTAVGDGDVVLYVDDAEVSNPYTVARPEAGDDAIAVYVYATAQEPGKEMSQSDVERVVVEPKEGEPADPHKTGVWIVTINKDGGEEWKEMMWDDGDYTSIVRFEYGIYGTFPYNPALSMEENDAMRPNVSYYIVVDGIRYGANADGTLTVLGEALNNPLYEGENLYVLEHAVGRVYQMGVAFDPENDNMYVYAAVAAYTDVEEMNAAKTVAGVRYFNMAGQEMQKAEGMTIVVTTYTDGTTSAVKVMK